MNFRACTAILLISLGLAACAGQQDQNFGPPVTAPTGLTQADINNSVTLYASDGTSLVEVTGKGTTTGTWSAKDGQLCEAFAPAPFLPKGVALNCQPMTGSGNVYQVGQATFTLA